MNVKDLYNVVEKLIMKKYPWIVDFEWSTYFDDGINYWTLEIFPSKEFRDEEIFMDKYEVEIEDEMKFLFKMLGPNSNERFDRVFIK